MERIILSYINYRRMSLTLIVNPILNFVMLLDVIELKNFGLGSRSASKVGPS